MKKIIIFLFSIIFISNSCRENDIIVEPTINLGVEPNNTEINEINISNDNMKITYVVTKGSKYSFQIYEFTKNEPLKTLGFTAEKDTIIKNYDISDLPNGLYDLVLTDISGNLIKKPILIKH